MAQEYTVEQLNHGRKVYDFMRWDYWAFGISGFLLIAAIVVMGVRGFNWGLDFTGGTVIEITLEKPTLLLFAQSSTAEHMAPDCETRARLPTSALTLANVALSP